MLSGPTESWLGTSALGISSLCAPSQHTEVIFFPTSSSGLELKRLLEMIKTWVQVHKEEKRDSRDMMWPNWSSKEGCWGDLSGCGYCREPCLKCSWKGRRLGRRRKCELKFKWVERKKCWDKGRRGQEEQVTSKTKRKDRESRVRLTTNYLCESEQICWHIWASFLNL